MINRREILAASFAAALLPALPAAAADDVIRVTIQRRPDVTGFTYDQFTLTFVNGRCNWPDEKNWEFTLRTGYAFCDLPYLVTKHTGIDCVYAFDDPRDRSTHMILRR